MKKMAIIVILSFVLLYPFYSQATKFPTTMKKAPAESLLSPDQEMIRRWWEESYAIIIAAIKNEVAIRNNLEIMKAALTSNDCRHAKPSKNDSEELMAKRESKLKDIAEINKAVKVIDNTIDKLMIIAIRLDEVAEKSNLFSEKDFDKAVFIVEIRELNKSFQLELISEKIIDNGNARRIKSKELLANIVDFYKCKNTNKKPR